MSDARFSELWEALRQAGEGLTAATQGLTTAVEGIKRAADASRVVEEEHEDLRETVRRLEGLIEELLRRRNGDE
jgi:hypothetical protein